MRRCHLVAAVLLLVTAVAAHADTMPRDILGASPDGQAVAFRVIVDFTPTGGNFAAGTGTADVTFTLLNTSSVFAFQSPALGNPLLTGFYFNVPPGTGITYTEARILAGATLFSSGVTLNGIHIPEGCHVTTLDTVVTSWYAMGSKQSTGQYGMFTNQLTAGKGNKPALAAPGLFVGCARQGYFSGSLVIAGTLRFALHLDHLGPMLASASGFIGQCSTLPGDTKASSLGAKFQGTDLNGQSSAFVGDPCGYTPTQPSTWGQLKTLYR